MKGWSLAVFWKHECKFFDGVVVDYDGDLDQHTIHYNDGIAFLQPDASAIHAPKHTATDSLKSP